MTDSSQPKPAKSDVDVSGGRVADATTGNWVDRYAPNWFRPFGQLARFDRPIGAWLLLFPCWWGQALGEIYAGHSFPNIWYILLFFVGAFVMRGAGCTYNDIVDRNYDGRVERTASRPIPSGRVSVAEASAFAGLQCLIGLAVLLHFNWYTVVLGASSLLLVAAYPFAKRFTFWPQLVLGLTFKWGALVGFTAIVGTMALPSALLYIGCILWTIGYDTIYAHQDKEDDALLGLKSTALRFGAATHAWLTGFYIGAILFWFVATLQAGAGWLTISALGIVALHMVWQITTLDTSDGANCLERFKSNRIIGWIVFIGLLADMIVGQSAGRL
ncbi:MAG: 4-hydroxybenzoate octaprenyltransferase [Hyphomicrobiaceae bacterium]|nr:4-hydroxybenzoate octaprenyltransferase [Hyphomicrobiaceae bacterium]